MSTILDFVFPRNCYSCGKTGRYLCLDCQSKLVVKSIKKESRLALFRYHDPIKSMIHDLKFNFVTDLAPEFSLLVSRTLTTKFPHLLKFWQDKNFILVPIPLHQRRYNWRGYNQVELLANKLSPLINLKSINILIRTKNTQAQTSIKDKLKRHTNVNSAFKINNNFYKNIILFDDVYTTGSTIRSAISAFPQGTNIWILTIA